jgi:hypothetical protein
MSNQFDYRCPKCGDTDQIDICAEVWVRLTEDGSDADLPMKGDHHWDESCIAECGACSHQATVADFDPE